MKLIHGWLLDLYTHPQTGKTCLWIIEENGNRTCVWHSFPGIFYFTGQHTQQFERVENYLYEEYPETMRMLPEWQKAPIKPNGQPIYAVHTPNPVIMRKIFYAVEKNFPDLEYYNVDVDTFHYYAAYYGVFPLCKIALEVDESKQVISMKVLNSQWELDEEDIPPLQILKLTLNSNPQAVTPTEITIDDGTQVNTFQYRSNAHLASIVAPIFRQADPDIIVTEHGDDYLIEALQEGAKSLISPFKLNRDLSAMMKVVQARTYHSYGQIIHRPRAILLAGRHHIDMQNAFFWKESELDGLLEVSRITGQSLQRTARTTPGTGISSMQIIEALRSEILVPYKKQLPEQKRSAMELLRHDMGGFQMQPIIGLHANVGAIDFISMYPSLMVHCNISPECEPHSLEESHQNPGLIPRTLQPLLEKRIALKLRMLSEDPSIDEATRLSDKHRSEAMKWLLVTCFGYLGYKNARFGRIESHEAVTGAGRECLLQAKETAEDLGFLILHALVDSLFVQQEGFTRKEDFLELINAINNKTRIMIGLDGVFRWVAFPPSRMDARVPVPNRYFGVFQDGSIKVRGIESRRRDTPPYIKETQMHLLEILAQAETLAETKNFLQEALNYAAARRHQLASCDVPVEELVIRHKLSRSLDEYLTPTPASIAAQELVRNGTTPGAGEIIEFVHTKGEIPARLWQLNSGISRKEIAPRLYLRIFDRATDTVLGLFQQKFPEVLSHNHQYVLPISSGFEG